MKKVFIMTPMEIDEYVTSEMVNTYIRKAAGAAKAIIDEDVEVETNFFLEPVGTDADGEPIMQVRKFNDEIAYMAEELQLMQNCEYIVLPAPEYNSGVWSCSKALFREFNISLNGKTILELPIRLVELENEHYSNIPVNRSYPHRPRRYYNNF